MARLIPVADAAELARAAAVHVAQVIRAAVRDHGCCSVAVCGGVTPRGAFRLLRSGAAGGLVPWTRVEMFFGDERCVPAGDPRSNLRMVTDSLLGRGEERRQLAADGRLPPQIQLMALHRMRADHPDRDEAAREYEALLPGAFDLVLLGIGADGHTASLFPGSPALREHRRGVLPVLAPIAPRARLTITPFVLTSAREVLMLASGSDKARAVDCALQGPLDPVRVPAQLARHGTWIVDAAAGALLRAAGGARPAFHRPGRVAADPLDRLDRDG